MLIDWKIMVFMPLLMVFNFGFQRMSMKIALGYIKSKLLLLFLVDVNWLERKAKN
jgi:hypothetical protein